MARTCYVYIVTNRPRGILYTGMTNNLQRRLYEHRERLIPGFAPPRRHPEQSPRAGRLRFRLVLSPGAERTNLPRTTPAYALARVLSLPAEC